MDEQQELVEQFEANRTRLQAVAYRLLGSLAEADDAVQETWIHLSRADMSVVQNLGGWLTTVIARICLDMLRARKLRREESLEASGHDRIEEGDPEQEAILADSVGLALLVVLDKLAPIERITFVLHDVFAVPFDSIAPVIERSATATRKLASRARQRVHGTVMQQDADHIQRQRELADAFLSAAREGSFNALFALLDPDVVFRYDHITKEVHGAAAVAKLFSGRAKGTQSALLNGVVGIVVAPYGHLAMVLNLTFIDNTIAEISVLSNPARLNQLDITV